MQIDKNKINNLRSQLLKARFNYRNQKIIFNKINENEINNE